MLTAYDYPTARILDEAGIPSSWWRPVADNGSATPTRSRSPSTMLHHTRAVAGAANALIVGDMPFMSYQPA
jgi:3-methyl-2-oxobutanoate hydroxymethyltransferase